MNRDWSYFFLGIIAAMTMIMISVQSRPLNVRPGVPNGMVTYQLSGEQAKVREYNGVWHEKGLMPVAEKHIWLDFIYILIYSLFFYTATKRFILLNPVPAVMKYRGILIFVSLLPGILDVFENIFVMKWLNGNVDEISPGVVFITASLKYGLAAILLFGAIYDWIRVTSKLFFKKQL